MTPVGLPLQASKRGFPPQNETRAKPPENTQRPIELRRFDLPKAEDLQQFSLVAGASSSQVLDGSLALERRQRPVDARRHVGGFVLSTRARQPFPTCAFVAHMACLRKIWFFVQNGPLSKQGDHQKRLTIQTRALVWAMLEPHLLGEISLEGQNHTASEGPGKQVITFWNVDQTWAKSWESRRLKGQFALDK